MASTNRKSRRADSRGYEIFGAVVLFFILVFIIGEWYGSRTAEQDLADAIVITPEVVEEPLPDVVITVDNIGCVIAEVPVITYYVATDTARVTIECDSDILFHYLPAVEVVGSEQASKD